STGRPAAPSTLKRQRQVRGSPHAGTRAGRSRLGRLHLADDRPRARPHVWARMACLGPGCKERAPADRRKPIEITDMAGREPGRSNMLHIRIVWAAGALGRDPVYVFIPVLYIARLFV